MKNTTLITTTLKNYKAETISLDDAIATIQSAITAHSGTRAHAGLIKDDKLVAKWCSKHQQYELATTFPKNTRSTDGLYSHCRFAEKRAKSYSAKIMKLKDDFFKTEDEKIHDKIKLDIKKIEAVKNDYDFKEDVTEEVYEAQVKFEKDFKKELAELKK